jgi:hypothetical protein
MTMMSLVAKATLGLITAGFLFPFAAQSVEPLNSAKVVYVGHSLINNNMPEMVRSLVDSRPGLSHRNAVQVLNGTNIENNWLRCRKSLFVDQYPPSEFACDAIDVGTDLGSYDNLIITQVNNPILDANNETNLNPYLNTVGDFDNFLDLFLTRNPSGRAYFYTPWEGLAANWLHGLDWTAHIPIEIAAFERAVVQIEAFEKSQHGRTVDVNVIPASLALRNLILAAESGQFAGITNRSQLFVDDIHMSPAGNYFVACVVFSTIYQQSPAGATRTATDRFGGTLVDLPADLALRLQNFAWQQVSQYRGWVTSQIKPRAPTLSVR